MGNQQTTHGQETPFDQKTPDRNMKQHPGNIKSPQRNQLPINSPPSKMKRPASIFENSMGSMSQVSRSKVKRKNSADNVQINQRLEQEELLSSQEIDNIYFLSESNLQEFFENLQEPLSKVYMGLAKNAINLMNNRSSQTDKQAKLFLSQRILNINLNIMKTLGQKKKHQFDENIFKKFNELQRLIIGYLKAKYPRGQQKFVSGDLMNAFKQFDYVDNPQNDILKQAGFYFSQSNVRDLMKKVKGFLNSLIDEVDVNFPRFQRILQQKVFKTAKSVEKSLAYKINRRLPESVSKFISVNSNSLDILSPQLFRVVLKWIEDMQQFILNPDEEVDSKQTLKVINQEDGLKYITDQINTQDNYFVMKQLKQKLHDEKENYQRQLNHLIENMYKFQHNLIKIIEQAELSQRYVPRKDAQIIKFAAYNTKFMSWMLAQKLTIAMKILINLGKHFKNTRLMMPLDLIKFNVVDLLRATLKGSKSELLQVYANLKKLESEDEIKIIRLENQLATALNGIVINFKMKNCFLICQVSLVLSESNQSSNQKLKNIEKLNNFFSDIESSPYGVLSELAEYVGYKDSKIGYENKVNFVSKFFGIPICEIRHPIKIQTIRQQYEPFVCTSCSRFYGRLQNTFLMKRCKECNNFLCCKCIFEQDTSLESNCLKEENIKYLNDQATFSAQATRGKAEGAVQGITGNLIYQKSFQKIIYMKEIQKERKIKKMNRTQFQVYIDSQGLRNFIYGTYQKGEIVLISLKYNLGLKQISFGMDKNEDFYTSKKLRYKQNDFLLIFDSKITFAEVQTGILQKKPFINIFSKDRKLQKGKYESYKINETNILVGLSGQGKQQKVIIDGVQVIDSSDYNAQGKKDFRFQSLKNYLEYHGILQSGRGTLKLQDLGIEKCHLLELSTMPWMNKILELNISNNRITEITEILKYLPNLERLSATQNYIQAISFPIKLNNLSSLVLKRNLIKSIQKIQNIPNIKKINLQATRIQKFPIVSLKELRHLNLAQNFHLTSIEFLQKSTLPQLNYINLQNSLGGIQYTGQDEARSIILLFPQLKCFICNQLNTRTLIINSSFLERLQTIYCPITEITIRLLDTLQYFIASYCKITNIGLLFNKNNQNNVIKQIDLSYNVVDQLPPFIKSMSLLKLNINSNKITNISPLAESSLPLLEALNIGSNQINFLPALQFPKLSKLQIDGNPFDQIQQFAKSSLPLIEILEFSATPIKSWPKFILPGVKDLSLPSLQNSTELSEFQSSELPNLRNLSIQNTKLNKFPFINFPLLQSLKIWYSTFQQMDTLAQCKLANLKKIDITNTNIEDYNLDEQQKKQELKKYKIDLPNNLDMLEQIYVLSSQFVNIENLVSKPLRNLSKITIQYTNLSTLPKMTLPNLKQLILVTNKINNIMDFCDSQLPQIQQIDLSNNQITTFKKLTFKNLKNLKISLNALEKLDSIDLPNLNRLDFSFNKLTQFPVIWSQKLTDMAFDANPLKNLKNLQKCHIPNLNSLTLSSIQLDQGERVCQKLNFPSIQTLTLYSINFTEISNVNSLVKLQTLTISYCTNIQVFPCLNLPQLKSLNISYTECKSWKGFDESIIENVNTLMIIATNMEVLRGVKLPNLIEMTVTQNSKLISVEQFFSYNKFIQLQSISLSNNQQLIIDHEINIPTLKKIDLAFVSMSSNKLIGTSERLSEVRISQSNFTEINLRQFKKLASLEMISDNIQNIDSFCTKQWRSLKSLYLTDNKITQVPKMTVFPILEFLNLDGNLLQNVSQLMENSSLLSLTYLCLNNNKIKTIKTIKNFPKLTSLYIEQNELQSLSFLSKLQNGKNILAYISLKNNKIKIDNTSVIKCGVETFQLNNNLISSIQWLKKSELPKLSYLDLSNNSIKKLTTVSNLNKLSTLIINQNPIEDYSELLFKQKIIPSLVHISISCMKSEDQTQADVEKFNKIYPNIYITISSLLPKQQAIQNPVQQIVA